MTSTTRGRGRPRETSAEEIRSTARVLFAEHGFDQVSLSRIADAVGIGRTTLFAYFSSKRELMWDEFDEHAEALRSFLASAPEGPLVDVLIGGILVTAHYGVDEHDAFATRRRIVMESPELRAYTALRTTELAAVLTEHGTRRHPDADPADVGDLTHALMAAAARATDDWARDEHPSRSLDAYVADRLSRLVDALRAG